VDLIVRHGEREETLRIRRDGDLYEVTIGERTWRVESSAVGRGVHSLRVDGSHHEVVMWPQKDGVWWVSTAQTSGPVTVADPLTHLAAQAAGGKGAKRQQKVTAYMPGRVVAVLVEEGQEVQSGQGVVVLEAMKMENEIRAESDGTIRHVFVTPGQAVEGGDPLFELE
jgi:biotin carboxyl carrier protein